jgi:hypothetical protein
MKAKSEVEVDLANFRGHRSFSAITPRISAVQDVVKSKLEPFQIRGRREVILCRSRFQSVEDGNQIPDDSRLGGLKPEQIDIVEKITLVDKHGVIVINKTYPAIRARCNFSNNRKAFPRASTENKAKIEKIRLKFSGFVEWTP